MVTVLKCKSELVTERVLLNVSKSVGPIVKIETNPRDKLEIKIGKLVSVTNAQVKRGWVYLYCEQRIKGVVNAK